MQEQPQGLGCRTLVEIALELARVIVGEFRQLDRQKGSPRASGRRIEQRHHLDAELPPQRQIELGDTAGERIQVITKDAVHTPLRPIAKDYTLGLPFS